MVFIYFSTTYFSFIQKLLTLVQNLQNVWDPKKSALRNNT